MLSLALSIVIAVVAVAHTSWTYMLATDEIHALLDRRLEDVASRIGENLPGTLAALSSHGGNSEGLVVHVWLGRASAPAWSSDPAVRFDRDTPEGLTTWRAGREPWRIFTMLGDGWVVQVGQREGLRRRIAAEAAMVGIAPALVMIPLSWLAIFLIVRRAFRRMGELGERANRLEIGRLEALPTDDVPRELLPLVQSINRMIRRLSYAVEAEKTFIADAAHELRSPLTSLQIQADNLKRTLTGAASLEQFAALEQDISRNARMIGQLLRLARADAPLDGFPTEVINVRDMIPQVIAIHLPRAAAHGIDLGVEQLEDLPVGASPADLRAAISNLVDNAIQYTPDGGTVDLRAYRAEGFACVEVRDTGRGISEDALPRVFDRFFRADGGTVEGSGLGLAIVKAIAEKHRGTVSIANRTDVASGVVARICIPLFRRDGGRDTTASVAQKHGG
ncbi:HAMP domain-containing sensor histidine kinase [Cupriavidus respiraculi]|uniref:histidine kinase n=1 Tax=Cupriavidus respiraculi TaxID=195930 RepID=A0ABM8WJT6_9BURK|nr:HAMP domain-containing sensor histidine kinase [Cupriavidus respiraculi]CAG9167651.1 Adaptive-response sensory-kinase SasA [Cupriavidus respiraculi]